MDSFGLEQSPGCCKLDLDLYVQSMGGLFYAFFVIRPSSFPGECTLNGHAVSGSKGSKHKNGQMP